MNSVGRPILAWLHESWQAWNRFWFSPSQPHTLGAVRILAGAMLFYTHLIWTIDLMAFVGPNAWMSTDTIRDFQEPTFAWSYLWYFKSIPILLLLHSIALAVFAMLTLGLFTRVTSILSAIITLAYCHRLSGALFGLDQVNAMMAMYLAVGPSGAAYSLDRWLSRRRAGEDEFDDAHRSTIGANIAIRLMQCHLCVIYLFGGIGKMRGEMWWDGSAVWFAIANPEYQSLDITWLVRYPWFIALLTHVTVFWETFYAFLVWPRQTRPIMLLIAVLVHGGIALFLGMPTFGIAMIIANLAFVRPERIAAMFPARQGAARPAPQPTGGRNRIKGEMSPA